MTKWQRKEVTGQAQDQTEKNQGFWVMSTEDKVALFAKQWKPTAKPVATLTFIHGLGEHILRYDHVFTAFAEKGIQTLAWDQRGFGRTVAQNSMHVEGGNASAMVLGDSQGWAVCMQDILSANEFERVPDVPHFLMGHSMGGLLALCFAAVYGKQVGLAGVISSAPALRPAFKVPWLKRVVGSFLAQFIGSLNIPTEIDSTQISRDKAVVEAYQKDPFVHDKGSLRLLASVLENGERMCTEGWRDFDPKLPLLMMFGTQDGLTSFASGKEFFEKVQSEDKTFEMWDGFYHELHNEPDKDKVIQTYINWILKHVK